ncbi:tRNA lysidine(34) synthetase TilS [Plastorhodobacter daqingensis]|uniref:tRNA(Ile)-lysidine synthase n=1 Tax=Plastorhodobacter daqingensis TaxID=1387281 RepID=A0ABW2UQL9_9RHOB
MQLTLVAAFAEAIGALVPPDQPLGVAVSGGGDSLALLHLLHACGYRPAVATVDHGLRPESAAEAQLAAVQCRSLGLSHTTLRWHGWTGHGNLQAHARDARRQLLADWAKAAGVAHIALGHTLDDQAETVLLRLARGAGVDGLSGMAISSRANGIWWLRPLLGVRREDLRNYLRLRGIVWAEDPSNTDTRFERVRIRAALNALEPLGITPRGLAASAERLAEARTALDAQADELARQIVTVDHGDLVIDRAALLRLPVELRRRLLVRALQWVAPAAYPPRASAVQAALRAVEARKRHTVHGCLLGAGQRLRICREPAAVAGLCCTPNSLWDGRWRLEGPVRPGVMLRALGEAGLAQLDSGIRPLVPRASLLASPAVWEGDRLIAAPLANDGSGWQARLVPPCDSFGFGCLSH